MIFFQEALFKCHLRNRQFKKRNTILMATNDLRFLQSRDRCVYLCVGSKANGRQC